jgi:Raf kinase inhibitor-like YbhB/YbcL family protein
VQLTTSAFAPGGDIPVQYTCDGDDISPELSWDGVPDGTRTFVLIVDDPDAPRGTWVHWVVYDLPAAERALPQGVRPRAALPSPARQGKNDFGKVGYGGPCPPHGHPHRYYFRLYAVDTELRLAAGATRAKVDDAMDGHVLAHAEIMGRYQR